MGISRTAKSTHDTHFSALKSKKSPIMQILSVLPVFLISAILADSSDKKQTAADNAKTNADNQLCFQCNFAGGDDAKNCQNPTQGTTKTVACPKAGYCLSVNKVTTLANGQATEKLTRQCYQETNKPNFPAFANITFTQGETQCADATTSSNSNQGNIASTQSCVDVCQGSYCNTSTPEQGGALSTGAIAGIVIGSLVGLLLIAGLVVYFMKYHGREKVPTTENEMN